MTTPIIFLCLLTLPYFAFRIHAAATGKPNDPTTAIALGLALVFLFAGMGHVVRTEPMAEMLPTWVPARELLVYVTGVAEFLIAVAIFRPRWRHGGAVAAMTVLILFFPANIYAAFNQVGMGGHQWGPAYLLVRAPLQVLLVAWAYWLSTRVRPTFGGSHDDLD